MKKLHLLSIFFLLAAVSVAFTSCNSNDEPSMKEDTNHRLTEWVEPYAVMKGSVEDAKAYMSANQPRYELTPSSSGMGSAYAMSYIAKDKHSIGITYSFMDGGLYTAMIGEFAVNLDLVIECLQKKYISEPIASSDSNGLKCLYKFTNQKKDMVVKVLETSKESIVVTYTRK